MGNIRLSLAFIWGAIVTIVVVFTMTACVTGLPEVNEEEREAIDAQKESYIPVIENMWEYEQFKKEFMVFYEMPEAAIYEYYVLVTRIDELEAQLEAEQRNVDYLEAVEAINSPQILRLEKRIEALEGE